MDIVGSNNTRFKSVSNKNKRIHAEANSLLYYIIIPKQLSKQYAILMKDKPNNSSNA